MDILNLPIDVIKRYKACKADKELLAFAIAVKCAYSNSVLTHVTPYKVAKLFHVSHTKAKGLIDRARESELFTFHGDSLTVNSFKSRDKKQSIGRCYFVYKSDYCYKLDKKAYSIRELYSQLNRILLLFAINASDRDKFPQRNKLSVCARNKELTLNKLSNLAGVSKSEVHRILNDMFLRNEILKTSSHAVMVMSVVNEETVAEWRNRTGRKHFIYNPKDRSGWIFLPCSYSVDERSITEKFKHVIYTHKNRFESNRSALNSVKNRKPDFYKDPRNAAYF